MQTKLRIEDNAYLQQHPEIQRMLSILTERLLADKPSDPMKVALQFLSDSQSVKTALGESQETSTGK